MYVGAMRHSGNRMFSLVGSGQKRILIHQSSETEYVVLGYYFSHAAYDEDLNELLGRWQGLRNTQSPLPPLQRHRR